MAKLLLLQGLVLLYLVSATEAIKKPGGHFQLQNMETGYCAVVLGNSDVGWGQVGTHYCSCDNEYHYWTLSGKTLVTGGWTKQCLANWEAQGHPGVTQCACGDDAIHHWTFSDLGDGSFNLVTEIDDTCVQVDGSSTNKQLQFEECNRNDGKQKWRFYDECHPEATTALANVLPPPKVPKGRFQLQNPETGFCAVVLGDSDIGWAEVGTHKCDCKNHYHYWTFSKDTLISEGPTKQCLANWEAQGHPGVTQCGCVNDAIHHWTFSPLEDGTFNLVTDVDEQCVHVNSKYEDNQLQFEDCDKNNAKQKWRFYDACNPEPQPQPIHVLPPPAPQPIHVLPPPAPQPIHVLPPPAPQPIHILPPPAPSPPRPTTVTTYVTVSVMYLILPDNSRQEIPSNQVRRGAHTLTIVYALLPDGTRKEISETDVIPTGTTTQIIYYTISPNGDKHKVTTQDVSSNLIKVVRYILLPSGQKRPIQTGQSVPQETKTVIVTYIVESGKPDRPVSETEFDIQSDITTTTIYVIRNGQRELLGQDVIPSATTTTVTRRYVISPSGTRRELYPSEPTPETSSTVTIIYLVNPDGSQREISEEEVTYSSTTKTTIKYVIKPGGYKQQVSKDVVQIQAHYIIGPQPQPQPLPTTEDVYYVTDANGNQRQVTKAEFLRLQQNGGQVVPQNGGSTETYYVTGPDGVQRSVSAEEYRRLQAGGGQVVTQNGEWGNGRSTETYFVTDAQGNQREVSAADYARLRG